ncbi:MAG: hypothetical protein IPK61_17305 [Saprospiraceae bacterium]|nr:hypothetical protein [Saprospiraceae bacterium]
MVGVYNLASTRIKIADQNSFTSINTNQGLTDYGIYSLGTTDAPSLHKKNNFTDLGKERRRREKTKDYLSIVTAYTTDQSLGSGG